MILACDVHYQNDSAIVAGVTFTNWESKAPIGQYISKVEGVSSYESGSFFLREMPCILRMLAEHNLEPAYIIVDGYVYLDGKKEKGLGAHLFDALEARCKIIGVAKNKYKDFPEEMSILRGKSLKPLYISSIGCEISEAKNYIKMMYGQHRLPSLIKLADTNCKKES